VCAWCVSEEGASSLFKEVSSESVTRTNTCQLLVQFMFFRFEFEGVKPCEIHNFVLICPSSFIHQWLYSPLLGPDLFFRFVIFFYTNSRTPWTSDQLIARPLPHTGQHKHRINAHIDIHGLSGIRTHDPSVLASEDSSYFESA
jgi:hypothetical protein